MSRYMTLWLTLILGLPVLGTLALTVAYQLLLGSTSFYPFWLAEIYLILWFPVSLVVARLVYWGKRKPVQYFCLTLLLLTAVILFGTWQLMDDFAPIVEDQLLVKGIQNESLITEEDTYRLAYIPYNQNKMIDAIRKEEPIAVYRLAEKEEIIAFANPSFIHYSFSDRLLNLLVGLVSSATFLILFINILGAWTRKVRCTANHLVVRRWWQKIQIPLKEIIFVQVDLKQKEVTVETEETAMTLPYGPGIKEVILEVVDKAGLISLFPDRWIRQIQYEEISIVDEKLVIKSKEEVLRIPFSSVTSLIWEGVIRFTVEEESEYLITDRRYIDKAWFDELAMHIQSVWQKEKIPFQQEVNPISGVESLRIKDM